MLKRRVARAVDFVSDIRVPMQIIFAGKHPPRKKVWIPNEATRMLNLFKEIADKKQVDMSKIELHSSDREQHSTDTISNLNNILGDKEYINHAKRNFLVVISSTFHLIRLGQRLNSCIAGNEYEIKSYIDRVALVGAESPNDKLDRHTDNQYMKLMLFELYHAHMQ